MNELFEKEFYTLNRTHLFFDDKPEFIVAVNDAITATGIPLIAIHCPHGEVELYDESGSKIKKKRDRKKIEKYCKIKKRSIKTK